MRIPTLCFFMFLCILSNLVLHPYLGQGYNTVDFPILFLIYLAQIDRKNRIYILAIVLAITRRLLGAEDLISSFFPILVAIEGQVLAKRWIHVRDAWIRILILAPFVGLVVAAKITAGNIHSIQHLVDNGFLWRESCHGALTWTLSAALLFPILDALRPHMRSYRHPL